MSLLRQIRSARLLSPDVSGLVTGPRNKGNLIKSSTGSTEAKKPEKNILGAKTSTLRRSILFFCNSELIRRAYSCSSTLNWNLRRNCVRWINTPWTLYGHGYCSAVICYLSPESILMGLHRVQIGIGESFIHLTSQDKRMDRLFDY